jgi:hypothetical protein
LAAEWDLSVASMKSASQYHFPEVFLGDGRKWLFNPVLKKRFKNRPEERVRLQWVDFLLHQTDWSKNRIGFETPVQLRREDRALRADLLLYSNDVAPHVLIECKSDQVKLTDSTAVQAARYNSLLHAPYVILTNGKEDLIYKVEGGKAASADYPFNVFQEPKYRDLGYWQKRGCCSEVIQPELKKCMEWLQSVFWRETDAASFTYLSFKDSFLPIPMDHFYQIFARGDAKKLAITLIGYGESSNYLLAVLNQKSVNRGVCVVNLDELFAEKRSSIKLFSQKKERNIESREFKELITKKDRKDFQKTLVKTVLSFFD